MANTNFESNSEENEEQDGTSDFIKTENNSSQLPTAMEQVDSNVNDDNINFENRESIVKTEEQPIQFSLIHSNLKTTTQNVDIVNSGKLAMEQMMLSDQSIGSSTENLTNSEDNVKAFKIIIPYLLLF